MGTMNVDTKKILDDIAKDSIYAKGVASASLTYCCKLFQAGMIPGSVLELGPAEGLMTKVLYGDAQAFLKWSGGNKKYTVVEGSSIFAQALQERYPNMDVHACLVEEYEPETKYENIILGHVLEHVENPVAVLLQCRDWLTQNGRIFAAVPNAKSIHRQAAVKMGLLGSVYDFSEKDRRHGHKRVFDRNMFLKLFDQTGYVAIKSGGYWLKPLSDRQIEESWTQEMIQAFLLLGEEYPDIAGETYVIASKQELERE